MLKKTIFFTAFLICNTIYTMELTLSHSSSFPFFPKEIKEKIFSYAIGDWQSTGNWKENKEKFKKAVNTCRTVQLIGKEYSSINKIAQIMNINDTNRDMLLIRAAEAGTVCLLKYAIALNATLNYTEHRDEDIIRVTPLSVAVRGNHYKSCLCLLEAGADVHKQEEEFVNDGCFYQSLWQPIYLAIYNNNITITDLLIKYGANVNSTVAPNRKTPLEIAYACKLKNKHIINLLVSNGAKKTKVAGSSVYIKEANDSIKNKEL